MEHSWTEIGGDEEDESEDENEKLPTVSAVPPPPNDIEMDEASAASQNI